MNWRSPHSLPLLGHLTEDGWVIRFLMERVWNARHAGPQDLEACQETLSRLHALGISHGNLNQSILLIRGEKAVFIDFVTTRELRCRNALVEESEDSPGRLQDLSNRGGGGIVWVKPFFRNLFVFGIMEISRMIYFVVIDETYLYSILNSTWSTCPDVLNSTGYGS